MESPVVLDKPPEYYGNPEYDRGFPFEEDESGAWSNLASRHPDIAARLRQRPQNWARKRRPQDGAEDFGDQFGGFERFPFEDIPPEFRGHFPSHWNRRFGPEDQGHHSEAPPPQHPPPQQQPQQPPPQPHQPPITVTTSTQTEPEPEQSAEPPRDTLPQHGLRNTVDFGQKSPVDPSLVDEQDRSHRSVSAPPDSRPENIDMSSQTPQQHQDAGNAANEPSNVRHIPIFVEGRDEPVINRNSAHFAEHKPTFQPSPPHVEREYFPEEAHANYHAPPNFTRAFGAPFGKGFRQGPQPFVQQKVYPQAAYGRANSPHRSQSPMAQAHPDEHYVKVPVHHETAPKTEQCPSKAQQRPQQQQQAPQQQQRAQPPPQQPQPPPPQPKPQQPAANDPIAQILNIEKDVLNLMGEVEKFAGAKNDKQYLFLDEMLTRNLIKLDTIETEGKENIRQARKVAIKCIQNCIAALEAKAEANAQASTQDVDMNAQQKAPENGELEMKDHTKEQAQENSTEGQDAQNETNKEAEAVDTRPDSEKLDNDDKKQPTVDNDKKSPKKKVVKKRDKSKDAKDAKNVESMQVDDKGDKVENTQAMEVEGAVASQ